jgi:hypothetical protein
LLLSEPAAATQTMQITNSRMAAHLITSQLVAFELCVWGVQVEEEVADCGGGGGVSSHCPAPTLPLGPGEAPTGV